MKAKAGAKTNSFGSTIPAIILVPIVGLRCGVNTPNWSTVPATSAKSTEQLWRYSSWLYRHCGVKPSGGIGLAALFRVLLLGY